MSRRHNNNDGGAIWGKGKKPREIMLALNRANASRRPVGPLFQWGNATGTSLLLTISVRFGTEGAQPEVLKSCFETAKLQIPRVSKNACHVDATCGIDAFIRGHLQIDVNTNNKNSDNVQNAIRWIAEKMLPCSGKPPLHRGRRQYNPRQ